MTRKYYTFARMQKTLGQLENEKPTYVFIEKKLYHGPITRRILSAFSDFDNFNPVFGRRV